VLCVIKSKPLASMPQGFRSENYEILLTEVRTSISDKTKVTKQLPKVMISYESEPTEALLSYLYQVTGKEKGGLKGITFV